MSASKPIQISSAIGVLFLLAAIGYKTVHREQEATGLPSAKHPDPGPAGKKLPPPEPLATAGGTVDGPHPRTRRMLGRRDRLIGEITAETAHLTLTQALSWAEKFEISNDYILAVTTIIVKRGRENPGEVMTWYNSKVSAGKPEKEIAEVAGSLFGSTNCLTDGQMKLFCSDRFFGTRYFSGLSINHAGELEAALAALSGNANLGLFEQAASGGLAEAGNLDMATSVANRIKSAKQRAEALGTVAYENALEEPEKAVEAFNSLPAEDAESRSTVASRITAAWFTHNSLAASEWVRSLPEGPAKDNAISTLACMLRRADPEGALVWAQSIGDAGVRDHTIKLVKDAEN